MTLPASEETVAATDAIGCLHDVLSVATGFDGMTIVLYYGRSVTEEDRRRLLEAHNGTVLAREQAVRECAEIAREIATDVRNGSEARFQAGVLATRILSLSQVSAKK